MQETRPVHFTDLLDFLNAFEEEHAPSLSTQAIDGYNVWYVVKKPLYFSLKESNYKLADAPDRSVRAILRLITEPVRFAGSLLFATIARRNRMAIISHGAHKRDKVDDLLIDKYMDPVVLGGGRQSFLYLEYHLRNDRRRTLFHPDVDLTQGNIFLKLLQKKIARQVGLREKAAELAGQINAFSTRSGMDIRVGEETIVRLLAKFLAEKALFRLILGWTNARRLFITDGIPGGIVAAGRSRRIPVFEFQHGFIFHNKPDYIVNPLFAPVKATFPVPDRFCVFGPFFEKQLLANGFWMKEEMVVLGNYGIDRMRREAPYRLPGQGEEIQVLLATQPTAFAAAQTVLEEIAQLPVTGVRIHLKFHPNESEKHLAWYAEFATRNADRFSLIPRSMDYLRSLLGKHLMISFYSTTILEAIALGYPVISIRTEKYKGVFSEHFDMDVSEVIRSVSNGAEIAACVRRMREEPAFLADWSRASREAGEAFYVPGFEERVRQLLAD
jgi:hypothetical protein